MTRPLETMPERQPRADLWRIAAVIVVLLALVTRLVALGDRAVSHDETTHAKYAWNLYSGRGFRHDPLMHGPLLFEVTAGFYALFGVSDFTARLYAALAGVALVASPWLLRRWLGRWGALITSVMLLISPAITYYSRYTRHDIPIVLFTALLLWSVLSYLEKTSGGSRWLVAMGIFFALMYASKENAYIYTAIFMGLWALPLAWQIIRVPWQRPRLVPFVLFLLALAMAFGGLFVAASRQATAIPEGQGNAAIGGTDVPVWGHVALGGALVVGVGFAVAVVSGVGEARVRQFRMFDVLVVLGTFTLPLGSAVLMDFVAGVDMTSFYQGLMAASFGGVATASLIGAFVTLAVSLAASVAIGLWWDRRRWPIIALAYYGVFFVLYSTFFTYGWGVLSGLVGGLAYWLAQQGVERGSQPWYYYGIVGPLYEYMPLLISLVGSVGIVVAGLVRATRRGDTENVASEAKPLPHPISESLPRLLPWFLMGWAALSWVAYIVAGEKMPWLFVHIAYPHILLAAWCLDRAIAEFPALAQTPNEPGRALYDTLRNGGWLVPVSLIFLALAWAAFRQSSGALQEILQQSGAGQELALTISQLEPLGRTIGGLIGILLFSGLLFFAVGPLGVKRTLWLTGATVVLVLAGLTVRTMVHLAFVNDEMATEYLVYAHATPDVNKALAEIEELSWLLTGTPDQIQVAYGKDVAWPFYWYMDSQYPNNYYFDTPDPERLLESPVILAADSEWSKVEAITGSEYDSFDYKHIWWPVEDYKDLTWDKVRAVFTEPERRQAIWDIVWDRDYTAYARLRNPEDPFTLSTWPHRMQFRLYVRRDVAERLWSRDLSGGEPAAAVDGLPTADAAVDPLVTTEASITPSARYGLIGSVPQGLAVAPDGTYYVTDSGTHQVLHLSSNGQVLHSWGGYGTAPGQFNEPWGVAVDSVGSVYVADTWNHRVQKFTSEGEFLLSWGRLAEVTSNDASGWGAFYGPRGIAIGQAGLSAADQVYVADTGNDRIQVFDSQGGFIRVFGSSGDDPGQLAEPVGLAVGPGGEVYVADTWHRRIQVFDAGGFPLRDWPVPVWANLRLEDRPQLALLGDVVYATDPVYQRVLVYDADGEALRAWRDATGAPELGGIAATADGVAVVDRMLLELVIYPTDTAAPLP